MLDLLVLIWHVLFYYFNLGLRVSFPSTRYSTLSQGPVQHLPVGHPSRERKREQEHSRRGSRSVRYRQRGGGVLDGGGSGQPRPTAMRAGLLKSDILIFIGCTVPDVEMTHGQRLLLLVLLAHNRLVSCFVLKAFPVLFV